MRVVRDINKVPDLVKRIEKLKGKGMQVGIFGGDDSEVLLYASVQEYGAKIRVTEKMRGYLGYIGIHLMKDTEYITIPERSFIRSTFDEKKSDFELVIDGMIERYVTGQIEFQLMVDAIGEYLVSLVRKQIVAIDSPPNHPATIEQKGSSNPLVDTGRMIDSITFKVVDM